MLLRALTFTAGPRVLGATTSTATTTLGRSVRLGFRTEVVLARTEARHEALVRVRATWVRATLGTARTASARTAGTAATATATIVATIATGTARTAGSTGITTSAARTARTARTAGATRTASTTWTTSTTGTTASGATTTTITEVARCRGELPANTGARHLAASRTIVFLLLFLGRADLERAEAARLVAIAATAEATTAAATAATRTATAATLATALAAAAASTAIFATTFRRTRNAIDHVVELTARDRAVRAFLALEHAHEPNLVDAITDDVERLEQTLGAIGLDVERSRDGIDRRIFLGGLCFCCGLTAAFGCGVTAFGCGVTASAFGRCGLGVGRHLATGCIGRLGTRCISGLDVARGRRVRRRGFRRRGFRRRRRRRRPGPTGGCACGCRITEQQRREFGESLHRTG